MLVENQAFLGTGYSVEDILLSEKMVVMRCRSALGADKVLLQRKKKCLFQGFAANFSKGKGFVEFSHLNAYSDLLADAYILLTNDGTDYTFFISLSHSGVHSSLEGNDEGITLHINNTSSQSVPVLAIVKGKKLHDVIKEGIAKALELTGGYGHLVEKKLPAPKWFESLGWETSHSSVSHQSIIESVQGFFKAGIRLGYVLIGEGWQNLQVDTLASFDADTAKFPEGLKGVIRDLHAMGVKHVGVWHGIMGARGGLGAGLARRYEISVDHSGRYHLGTDLGRTFQYYHDYYEYLRKQGVTFTKVGDQGRLHDNNSLMKDKTQIMKNLQTAIQGACSVQFDSLHFNAECLGNGNIFYWANSRIASISESAIPNQIIRDNLSGGLWLQYLMQPDFNSWSLEKCKKLAIFHALSGSLNVVRGDVNLQNLPLLKKMLLPSGKLLLADKILTLCSDSAFFDPLTTNQICKAFTVKGECGILGLFHLCSTEEGLSVSVFPSDIEELKGELFAVYSHNKGFLGVVKTKESLTLFLESGEDDALIFSPVKHGIAVFGSHAFLLCPAVLVDVDIEIESIHITMLVAGPLFIYSEKSILEVRRNGQTVPWEFDAANKTLVVDAQSPIIEMHATYTILFE